MKKKALVVLSGGQDSTTCLAMALSQGFDVTTITFDYGQRHSLEIKAAKDVATLCGVDNEVIELGPILKGMSPLTNPGEALETYKDHDSMAAIIGDRIEKTFVPMRNALFLTIAANRAAVLGVDRLITGVCQADNANYPDCRDVFIRRQGSAINFALGHDLNHGRKGPWIWLDTPLMNLSKAQSIERMVDINQLALLAFTHTAYDGKYPPIGDDHASILRAHGFEESGFPDPLVIRAHYEGLMPLPMNQDNYQNDSMNLEIWQDVEQLKAKLVA